MVTLTVTAEVLTTVRAHAERAWPEECVGALLGDEVGLTQARPLANAAVDRRSGFLVSARDYLAAEADAAARGLSLRGFYHSHPDGPAEPSARDAASATPGWWTLIIQVEGGAAAAPRAFWFDGAFHEGALS